MKGRKKIKASGGGPKARTRGPKLNEILSSSNLDRVICQ